MDIFKFLKKEKKSEECQGDIQKSNPYSPFLSYYLDDSSGCNSNKKPIITKQNFIKYYQTNPIVYKCIEIIANSLSDIDIIAVSKKNEVRIENHPFLEILKQPNPKQSETKFLYNWVVYYLVFGQSFVEKIINSRREITELNLVNPLNVNIRSDGSYYPVEFSINTGVNTRIYQVNQLTGVARLTTQQIQKVENYLYYLPNIDIDNSVNGLSKLQVCAYQIEALNFAMSWNRNLLQNSARPSGVISVDNSNIPLTPEQTQSLQEKIKQWQGSENAGKILLSPALMKYDVTSMSPAEMDFQKMIDKMSEYIASVFGVPPLLVVPIGTTFNNMAEAPISLSRDTILPLMTTMLEALSKFIETEYPDIMLRYDEESIDALYEERRLKIDAMTKAIGQQILTVDEGRKELGYEQKGGLADDLFIRQGQVPLDLAAELNQPESPDNNEEEENNNNNEEDQEPEGSEANGRDGEEVNT